MAKIALTGKGGVGKTTWAALLAYVYAQQGRPVIAIDADPAPSLANSLGIPPAIASQITPISEMADLIEERTGARPGTPGGYFRINPEVSDIPDRFSVMHRGIRLLQLGTVKRGGGGCICPESATLKALVTHLLLYQKDVVILDMEAGVEHLGRATAQAVDAFLIVVEPSSRSLQTALQIRRLAREINIPHIFLLANKVQNESDLAFIREQADGIPLLGYLPESDAVSEADRRGIAVFDHAPALTSRAAAVATEIDQQTKTAGR